MRNIAPVGCCLALLLLPGSGLRGGELLPPERPIHEVVDHYIDARLAEEGLTPAPPADDANFVRRLTLDLAGRIPTLAEVRAYQASSVAEKREQLVARLLESPGFVRYQAYELDAMLMAGYRGSLRDYLLAAVKEGRSWDALFRELLLEQGAEGPKGAAEFLKQRADDPDKMANDVSVLFFGVNISCAKCHDHPLVDDWKQDHFYGMRSFFSRTFDNGGFLAERDYGVDKFRTTEGEEKTAPLMFLTGAVLEEPESREPSDEEKKQEKQRLEEFKKKKQPLPPPAFSRRAQLIDVALKSQSGDDAFFARAIVNRVWHRLLGQALVTPVDQMHSANPPSHPELLDWLARDMAAHDYNLQRLVRGLVMSQAYARSSLWERGERPRPELFAVANVRPLTPQQYAASLRLATTDSRSLPDLEKLSELEKQMEQIDNAARGFAGELEMPGDDFQVGVGEALLFSKSERVLKEFLGEGQGRLITQMLELDDPRQQAEAALWTVFGREPAAAELEVITEYLNQREDRRLAACQQVVWALLTSSEFRFNY